LRTWGGHSPICSIVPTMALALMLGGCMVGPKYKTPAAAVPPAYKEAAPASFKEGDGWKTAQPGDQAIRGNWWEIFGDPQLNTLEQQLTIGNQDLKAAEARFRQARAMIRFNRAAQFPTISTAPFYRFGARIEQPPLLHHRARIVWRFSAAVRPILRTRSLGTSAPHGERSARRSASHRGRPETASLTFHAELAYDYFELRAADSQQRLLDDTVKAYTETLRLATTRFEGGRSAEVRCRPGADPARHDARGRYRYRRTTRPV